ncbi:RNA-directed DNA polymerase, eukaryota, partial [Tanacetum coccineum]
PISYVKLLNGELNRTSVNSHILIAPADGIDATIVDGSWLIQNVTLILKKKTPDANIMKEDVCNILVWVKFHDIPITAFTKDSLSVIATKLSTPLMLYYYTSAMCTDSLGRLSYARAMVELRAYVELKDTLVVVVPKFVCKGYTMKLFVLNTNGHLKDAKVARFFVTFWMNVLRKSSWVC